MAGLLTHLIISIAGMIIIRIITKKWTYGLSFGIGQLAPDLLDFGVTSIFARSLKPSIIEIHDYFYPLLMFGHNPINWMIIGIAIMILALTTYKLNKISKNTMITIIITIVAFIIGTAVHSEILDKIRILTNNRWI